MKSHVAHPFIAGAFALVAITGTARADAGGTAGGTIEGTVTARPAKDLRDTVVYLKSVPGTYPHRTVDLDQRGLAFVPHIVTITVGDTVRFTNHDPLEHNVNSPDCHYDLGTRGQGAELSHVFAKQGACTQLCKLHPEMLGFVFVGQNPYAAAVDQDGHYTIANVPPGTYDLEVWNAHLKGEGQKVTVTASTPTHADLAVHR